MEQHRNEDISDIDDLIEKKLLDNLKWSMLVFVFNYICNKINKEEDFTKKESLQKVFFKEWKKFVVNNIIKNDLQTINDVLNSPYNIFYSVLQNKGEEMNTTEDFQEKYNNIIKKIEKQFNENF